jgi:glycosyltransferase involved in cell wall biosynthesis
MACGEWVWFVDADDVIHPDALRCLSDITNGTTADFIYFDYLCGESITFAETSVPAEIHLEIKTANIPEMSQWRYVFRRMIAKTTRFENYIVGEDLLFSAKLSAEAAQIAYLPVPLYGYVQRKSSVMHSHSFQITRDSILWQRQILEFYSSCDLYKQLEKSRWNKFFFKTSYEIMKHSPAERKSLVDVWFFQVMLVNVPHHLFCFYILRNVFSVGMYCECAKMFMVMVNSLIFSFCVRIKFFLNNCIYKK